MLSPAARGRAAAAHRGAGRFADRGLRAAGQTGVAGAARGGAQGQGHRTSRSPMPACRATPPAGGLARLDWAVADKTDGVIVALGANDMLRGADPKHDAQGAGRDPAPAGRAQDPGAAGRHARGAISGRSMWQAFEAIYPELRPPTACCCIRSCWTASPPRRSSTSATASIPTRPAWTHGRGHPAEGGGACHPGAPGDALTVTSRC